MSDAATPRRPLWLAALLGGIPPVLLVWISAVIVRQFMVAAAEQAHLYDEGSGLTRPAAMLSGGWFQDIGSMLFAFVIAFLGVQFLLFLVMTVAERRQVQPPVAWLCAGVAATTPLVLYSVWPDASAVPNWQILMVYSFGLAAAWITRRLRHGAWL